MNENASSGGNGLATLEDLRRTLVTAPVGGAFDRQARVAAAALGAPAAVLVAADGQNEVWKGAFGLPGSLAARGDRGEPAASLVQHLGGEPLAVANALQDPRFAGLSRHPALKQAGLVAVLAVPLSTPSGNLPAWLAVMDSRPRSWGQQDIDLLRDLGRSILTELEASRLRGEMNSREEEAQREHREKAALLEGIPHGLFLLDPEGHMVLCNEAAARFFHEVSGRAPEQLPGMDIWAQCPEVADSSFARECRLAEQERLLGAPGTFQTEAYFPSLHRWYAFHGAHTDAGLCVAVQDITERVHLERSLRSRAIELAESNRGKEEFLLQLAHELRNSLAPIRNALHLWSTVSEAAGGVADEDSAEEDRTRRMAEGELQRISSLLDDLLKLSSLAPSDLKPNLARLDFGEVVGRAFHAALAQPGARGRRLSVHLPSEPLPLEGDRDMLEKVLAHLLDNAVKYTRSGGEVTVEVVQEANEAFLRVRDDGIGISPERLPRIFNMFMRAEPGVSSGNRLQGGVGVGLALVRRLVELHGGRVEARSEGLGHGSEFLVRLPALPPAALEAGSAGQPPVRVLIVDDSKQAADSLAVLMRMWGYDVRVAYDALSAIEDARAYPPRVVLLDLGMPGVDGYEAARRLRALEQSKDALLVAVTGYAEEEDRRRARRAGFDYHLVKPAHPDELRELLQLATSVEPQSVPSS
jgi:signal transduction histidine kinase/ActR/RegA family two-component response regulator